MKMIRLKVISSKIIDIWINVGCIESILPNIELDQDGEWTVKGSIICVQGCNEPYVVGNEVEDIISAISYDRKECGPTTAPIGVVFAKEGFL